MTTGGRERRERFLAALRTEISLGAPEGFAEGFDTIYLGGGTPSILDLDALGEIFAALSRHLPLADPLRISLEANPEDVTEENLVGWRRLGVTTLSLGVQSFDDRALALLGRRHDGRQARAAVTRALAAGFETVSMDLIYALPGREPADWRRELQSAIELAPDHLSCYQLTVHEGTPFGRRQERGERIEVPGALQARLFRVTHALLAEAGYEGYEVSNFAAAPRHRSPHNTKYWDHTRYLGLGPSAHSFDGRSRWWNERVVEPWRALVEQRVRPVAGREELDDRALLLERLMLALRTRLGVDLDEIERRYGVDLEVTDRERIGRWKASGWVTLQERRLCPTVEGMAIADTLARELGAEL